MPNSQAVARAKPKKLRCKCAHEFQDQRYGRGIRIANPTMKLAQKDGPSKYRCTVCRELLDG